MGMKWVTNHAERMGQSAVQVRLGQMADRTVYGGLHTRLVRRRDLEGDRKHSCFEHFPGPLFDNGQRGATGDGAGVVEIDRRRGRDERHREGAAPDRRRHGRQTIPDGTQLDSDDSCPVAGGHGESRRFRIEVGGIDDELYRSHRRLDVPEQMDPCLRLVHIEYPGGDGVGSLFRCGGHLRQVVGIDVSQHHVDASLIQ